MKDRNENDNFFGGITYTFILTENGYRMFVAKKPKPKYEISKELLAEITESVMQKQNQN